MVNGRIVAHCSRCHYATTDPLSPTGSMIIIIIILIVISINRVLGRIAAVVDYAYVSAACIWW